MLFRSTAGYLSLYVATVFSPSLFEGSPNRSFRLGYTSLGKRPCSANASPPYARSGYSPASVMILFFASRCGLNATAAVSFRFESFVRTMSRGIPGFTIAALMFRVPKSMPSTAALAVLAKRKIQARHIVNVDSAPVRLRPRASIVKEVGDLRGRAGCSRQPLESRSGGHRG